jgi:nicotinate-nucleotide adenylyltransferase
VFVFRHSEKAPETLAILAGSFNPPTLAHLALANAALSRADEVLFVVPKMFPHKEYVGASLDERVAMLRAAVEGTERCAVGISDQGLFIDIAREVREHFPESDVWFVCGRDAAERIVGWNYGEPGAFARMLDSFGLLVARRQGEYSPPAAFAHRIESIPLENYDGHSSTEVRERIAHGEPWRHLIPESIAAEVQRIYS